MSIGLLTVLSSNKKSPNDFEYGQTFSRSYVEIFIGGFVFPVYESFYTGYMSFRQIDDIDIVADGGSVGRIVVVAEYAEFLVYTGYDLHKIRNKIIGYSVGQFSYLCGGVGSNGIKIP